MRSAISVWLAVCLLLLTEGLVSEVGSGESGFRAGAILAMPMGIEADSVIVTPGQTLFLEPNVPNPFNKETKIFYTLDRETTVTIRVFDAFYNDVTTLVNEEPRTAGRHEVIFKPAGRFASTMYFYSLITSAGVQTRRMMLVR